MRWKGMLWAGVIILLAQSPAFARMHADSPPTWQSFIFIAIWFGAMVSLFARYYGAGRLALAFGVGTVASAIVLGEYVDSFLHPIFRVPWNEPLPLAVAIPCACLVSAIVQAGGAVWAGRMQGSRPIGFLQAMRGPAFWLFWVTVLLPGVYIWLKGQYRF